MLRKLIRTELDQYRALVRWLTRRPTVPEGATPLPYVGTVAFLLWAFIVGSAIETLVFHVILPWDTVRLVVDVLSVWGILFMLGYAATQYTRPHLMTEDALVLRSGAHAEVVVPWSHVAAVSHKERSLDKGRGVQLHDGVLSLVVTSRTNVDVRLSAPIVHGGTSVTEVRFLCDDPKAVVRPSTGAGPGVVAGGAGTAP